MNYGKVIMGLSLLLAIIFGSSMIINYNIRVKQTLLTPDQTYQVTNCVRDESTLIHTPEKDIYVHYTGMINHDTYSIVSSHGHKSWPVYYKTGEPYIKIRYYDYSTGTPIFVKFQVIGVRPQRLSLKLAKEQP